MGVIAQLMALGLGGMKEWKAIWSPAPMKVFSFIGFVYALGDFLEMASMGSLGGAAYQVLLQSKLLITALMMWGIKGAKQSSLQWNILILVMLSMCVYMIGGSSDSGSGGGIPIMGVVNVLLKVALSFVDGKTWQNGFFTGWNATTVGVLASFTVKGWSTMYLLAILDSVLKNIGEAVSVLVIYFMQVFLPVFEDSFEVPKFLSVMVVILSVTSYVGSKSVVEKAAKYDKQSAGK